MSDWNNHILDNQKNQRPDIIFAAYCYQIGNYFTKQDFKFFKRPAKMRRIHNELIESVSFESSPKKSKNQSIQLGMLPAINAKGLKRWMKIHGIGRDESIISLKKDYPQNVEIYGHSKEDFRDLTKEIEDKVLSKTKIAANSDLLIEQIIHAKNWDDSVIPDNFLCYLAMKKSPKLQAGIEKFQSQVDKDFIKKIKKIASN